MATVPPPIIAALEQLPALSPQLQILFGATDQMQALVAQAGSNAPIFGFPGSLPQAAVDAAVPSSIANAKAMKAAIANFPAVKAALDTIASVEPLLDGIIALETP